MKTITYLKTALLAIVLFVCGNVVAQETATLQLSADTKFGTTSGSQLTQENVTWIVTSANDGSIQNSYQTAYSGQQFGTTSTPWIGSFSTNSISGTITKIEIVANTGEKATLSVSVGGSQFGETQNVNKRLNETPDTYTFNGNETGDIVISISNTTKAFYLNKITVTYITDPNAIANPTFSAEGGKVTEAQNITINCATEGATIYYTIDGTEPSTASTQYTQAINITATTTVKAIAVKGEDQSAVVSATYTFPTEVANIAAFQTMQEGDFIKITGTVSVVFSDANSSVYIQDASGSTLIYDRNFAQTEGLVNGKTMTGLAADVDNYNGLRLTNVIAPALADGSEVEPTVVTEISAADLHKYVMFENVQFKADADFTERQGNGTLTNDVYVYNNLYNTNLGTVTADKHYNVAGFVSVYNNNAQLYPISITEHSTGSAIQNNKVSSIRFDGQTIYNPENANIVVYSLVGTVVAEGNTNIDMSNQNSGIYIVRAGKSVTKIVKQ